MAKKSDSKSVNKKKKSWFSIVAPPVFNGMSIGETTAVERNNLLGRSIKVSLMNLTRNMKKQNITVTFRIDDLKDNVAQTHVSAFETNQASVKRFVRRRRDKIDDSIVAKTKDGKLVRVKPMLITRNNTSNPVLCEMRHAMRYKVVSDIAKFTYGQFIEKIINDQFAKDIKYSIQKIYPVRNVSIRAFQLQEGTKEVFLTKLIQADADAYNKAKAKIVAATRAREAARAAKFAEANERKAKEEAAAPVKKEEAPVKDEASAKEEAPTKETVEAKKE